MKRWNIFARILEDILADRGLRLGHLDDRTKLISGIKVRRLRQSLEKPNAFPVLNPAEMDLIVSTFKLSEDETLHLRAAILTTAIEEELMDRIHQDDALLAAEQLFSTILRAMQKYSSTPSGLGAVRSDDTKAIEEALIDLELEAALEYIDHATLAWHLGRNVTLHRERIERAQQAFAGFEAALTELDELGDNIKEMDDWHTLYDEAQRGYRVTQERLKELGIASSSFSQS
jgi:hypothetical protein